MIKSAVFSDCRKYRYTLSRYWDQTKGFVMFICLNPSTANETKDDPTVRRCINYSKAWGYGGFTMTNLFAFRAADPKIMLAESNPIGPENTDWILYLADTADIVIAGWGVMGAYKGRANAIVTSPVLKDKLHYLALTKGREPRHPLYLKKILKPTPWRKNGNTTKTINQS